jgi:hypothetical protein
MNKYFLKKSVWIIILLPLLSIANIHTIEYQCPSSIEPLQSKIGSWEIAFIDHTPRQKKPSSKLYRGSLYDQSPDGNMAELIPDNDDDLGGGSKEHALWTFLPEDSFRHWVACNYYDTDLVARQLLPASVKSCEEIKELSSKGKLQGIKVVCTV